MTQALEGEQLCSKHQGNHAHYAPHNCTICRQLATIKELVAQIQELEAKPQEPVPTLHLDWLYETPITDVELFFYYTKFPGQAAEEGTFTVTTESRLCSEVSQLVETRKVAMQFPPIPSDTSCISRQVKHLEDRMEQIKCEAAKQRRELRREVKAILREAAAASIKKEQT